ncbi:MAG: rhomboid family intramembrane serine protease [Verrucomicrobiota bacterium]
MARFRFRTLTTWIILVNVLIALLGLVLDAVYGPVRTTVVEQGAPIRVEIGFLQNFLGLRLSDLTEGRIWKLFSYMWVHAPLQGWLVLHVVFNMVTLNMFGRIVEKDLGKKHYAIIYFSGGIISAFFSLSEMMIIGDSQMTLLIGASGGLLAVVAAFACLKPDTKLMVFPLPIPIKAMKLMWLFAGISILFMITDTLSFIGHSAHLGGLLWGFFYMWIGGLYPARKRYQSKASKTDVEIVEESPVATMSTKELLLEAQAVMDKVSREGMESLTDRDREILRCAQIRMRF